MCDIHEITSEEEKEEQLCAMRYNLPSPHSEELYAFCEKLNKDIGLNSSATALYWHLQSVLNTHVQK